MSNIRLSNTLLKILILAFCSLLAGCTPQSTGDHEVKVGTIAGPETELMRTAAKVAQEKYGLSVKIIEFEDYMLPNTALAEGSIDANMTQHQAYLNDTLRQHDYPIVAIGHTFIYPMGVYSKKHHQLSEIQEHAIVAIPNDVSNCERALLLLQYAKLITLGERQKAYTPADIVENPHHIKIQELPAAQLPRALPDVDFAAINTNYAMSAGLMPKRDALAIEPMDTPYANILVVRRSEERKPKLQELLKSLQSEAVLQRAKDLFLNQAIPAWQDNTGNPSIQPPIQNP